MPKTRRIVVIDWQDHDVTDSDEMQIWANSDAEATAAARKKWRLDVGYQWPGCQIVRCWVVPAASQY
jgi:hypothetical protein